MLFIWVKAGLMADDVKALGMPKENTKSQQRAQNQRKPMSHNCIFLIPNFKNKHFSNANESGLILQNLAKCPKNNT
jgi:hypothetical protein